MSDKPMNALTAHCQRAYEHAAARRVMLPARQAYYSRKEANQRTAFDSMPRPKVPPPHTFTEEE